MALNGIVPTRSGRTCRKLVPSTRQGLEVPCGVPVAHRYSAFCEKHLAAVKTLWHAGLTPAQFDIACRVAMGNTDKEIATETTVTLSYVKSVLGAIYSKLGISGPGARVILAGRVLLTGLNVRASQCGLGRNGKSRQGETRQ